MHAAFSFPGRVSRLVGLAAILALMPTAFAAAPAAAADKVTYLFPAPAFLPAFGPIQLAKGNGHFAREGIEVKFVVGNPRGSCLHVHSA